MSEEVRGTVPQRNRSESNPEADVLSKGEINRLYALGYKQTDIAELGPTRAREIISNKSPKPGSKAYLRQARNPLTGTQGVDDLVGRYSDEAVEERNSKRKVLPTPGLEFGLDEHTKKVIGAYAGANEFVVEDEYQGRILKGNDPMNALLNEYASRNPGKRFRLINPELPIVAAGPSWQPVYDAKGEHVGVAGLKLGWMPESVHREHYQEPNLRRSQAMTQQVKRNQEDGDLALTPAQAKAAPIPSTQRGPDGMVHGNGELEVGRSLRNYE